MLMFVYSNKACISLCYNIILSWNRYQVLWRSAPFQTWVLRSSAAQCHTFLFHFPQTSTPNSLPPPPTKNVPFPPPTFVPYGLGFGSIPSDYYAHEECVTHFGIDHECSGTSKTYDDVKVSIKTTSSICIFMLHMLIAVIAMQRCV